MPPTTPLIAVRDFVFDYDNVRALVDISFDIEAGMVVALVGPNGAGKTTLMRSICALEHGSAGDIVVGGLNVADHPRAVHRMVGYLPDFYGLYDELTVAQALQFHAGAKKITTADQGRQIAWAAALLELDGQMTKRVGELSRGNRQKVAIAQAIIHRPEIALLDEPASGLDPEARANLSVTIRKLNAEGMTLIVSSHILAELEDYSSHVMIIRDGRLDAFRAIDGRHVGGAAGEPAGAGEGSSDVAGVPWRIDIAGSPQHVPAALAGVSGVVGVEPGDGFVVVRLDGDEGLRARVMKSLIDAGIAVTGFAPAAERMSDVYFAAGRGSGRAAERRTEHGQGSGADDAEGPS